MLTCLQISVLSPDNCWHSLTHTSIWLFHGHLSVIVKERSHGRVWIESRQAFGKVPYGYVLKKQTSDNYRLTLVQELPLMHDVTRAVIPASQEEAQFPSSTTAHDASLSFDLFHCAYSSDRQTPFKDVQSFSSGAS